jgi:hypothetical protein
MWRFQPPNATTRHLDPIVGGQASYPTGAESQKTQYNFLRLIKATSGRLMAGKSDFNAEEWSMLRQAPFMASKLVIAAGSSGPVRRKKEIAAANRVIAEASESARTPLLKSLGLDLRQTVSLPKPDESSRSFHDTAVAILKQVCGLLERKASLEEAEEMKQWLNTIARRTAEAAKEGGFLGVGGTLVSDQEQEAIDTIRSALDARAA